MFLPKLDPGMVTPLINSKWGGLNTTDTISEAEFADMYNASCRKFPYVTSRDKRKVIRSVSSSEIQAVCAPLKTDSDLLESGDFCGIINDKFFYDNSDKDSENKFMTVSDKYRVPYPFNDETKYPDLNNIKQDYTLVPFSNCINIFPSMKSFDPRTRKFTDYEKSFGMFEADDCDVIYFYSKDDENIIYFGDERSTSDHQAGFFYPEDSPFKVGDRIEIIFDVEAAVTDKTKITYKDDSNNICNFNYNTFDDIYPEMRTALSESDFKSAYIVGCYIERFETGMNTKWGKEYVSGLVVSLYDIDGNHTNFLHNLDRDGGWEFQIDCSKVSFKIRKYVPPVKFACEAHGRIFTLDPFGTRITASAAGDLINLTEISTGADSPWFTEVGSYGEWTGICNFGGNVYCFKRDICYVIYGDNATNFALAKTINCGCVDGRSIAIVGNVMYFLSSDGFYGCSGSQPVKISDSLSKKYMSCVSGVAGDLYYASATCEGVTELLCYNTSKSLWHKEDNLVVNDFFTFGNRLYGCTGKEFFVFGEGNLPNEWWIESKEMNEGINNLKSVIALYFRMRIPAGAEAEVFIRYDGGEYIRCGKLIGNSYSAVGDPTENLTGVEAERVRTYTSTPRRFPVRFKASYSYQFKLVFHGDVVFEALERSVHICGR